MLKRILFIALLAVPLATANTAEIPALTGYGTAHFAAAWTSLDGQTSVGGAPVFSAIFGDSAARTTETDVIAGATFRYNVTNLRVTSGPANCGNLGAGETLTITLRRNLANSILSATCAGGAAAGSFTLDTDVIEIMPGDDLSFAISLAGTTLLRSPRLGITMEGYSNVTIQTEPVPDMVNEMLETVNVILPLVAFILVIIWAEITRELFVYILAIITGAVAIVALWPDVVALRLILVASLPLVAIRGWTAFEEHRMEQE